jgi:hypothetical protein
MSSRSKSVRASLHLAAVLALLPAWPASAQKEEAQQAGEVEVVVEEEEEEEKSGPGSRFSGQIQFDFTNAYFFRGILNERSSLIVQPWAEIYLNLFASDDGFIRDVTAGFGVWNSIHDRKTLAENSPSNLYETDWYPVLSIGLPGGVSYTTTYYWYTSPNGAFDTVEELNLELAWDDSEYLGRFAMGPYMNWAIETNRTSLGNAEGVGLQLGVEPTLFELDNDDLPLAFTFPLEVGLSVEDYYEGDDGSDETFGYISYGVTATLPIAFVDASYGAWSVILSGKGMHFGDTLAEVNKHDDNYGVVTGSIGVEF